MSFTAQSVEESLLRLESEEAMGRFDSIEYTDGSRYLSEEFKELFKEIEYLADRKLREGKWKKEFLIDLEKLFMIIGKAIKESQTKGGARNEY